MQLWYTCKENELSGPYSESEIKKMIETQNLGTQDWIRKEDEAKWQQVGQYEETASHFNAFQNMVEESPATWVVLKWHQEAYEQSGPFTNVAILNKIYQGELEYNDFVWKEGFDEWKRIGSVEEFIPKEITKEGAKPETKKVKEESPSKQTDIFDSLMQHKVNGNHFYEDVPEEAKVANNKPKNVKNERVQFKKSAGEIPSYYRPKKDPKKKWWFLSFFCLFLTLLFAFWGKSSLILYL